MYIEIKNDDRVHVPIIYQGKKGEKGDPGQNGISNIPGPAGETGDKGEKGDPGIQGLQGIQGPQGIAGEKGEKGEKGDPGIQGLQGIQGPQGVAGETGEKGEKGDPGIQGIQGIQGTPGTAGEKGEKGEKGDPGTQGIQGIQGPQGIPGETGDKGEKGDPGIQGIQGIQGPQGIPGETGEKGEKGDPGIQGIQGIQGPQGVAGETGDKGEKGDPGIQGIQGIPGEQGIAGETGQKGNKGEKGDPGDTTPEFVALANSVVDNAAIATDSKNKAKISEQNALNAYHESKSYRDEIISAMAGDPLFLGTYNADTGVAFLTENQSNYTPTVSSDKPNRAYFEITETGSQSITGSHIELLKGGKLISSGSYWSYSPPADNLQINQRLETIEEKAPGIPEYADLFGDLIPGFVSKDGDFLFYRERGSIEWKGVFDLSKSHIKREYLPSTVVDNLLTYFDEDNLSPQSDRPLWSDAEDNMLIYRQGPKVIIPYLKADKLEWDQAPKTGWEGKRIVWSGTSIPWYDAPNSYPEQVGRALGAIVYNNSISGSTIIFKEPDGSDQGSAGLSGTYSELMSAGLSQNNSYENRIVPYLYDPYNVSLVVIDHGPNDITRIYEGHLGTINSTDKSTFYGAYNTVIEAILQNDMNVNILITTLVNRYATNNPLIPQSIYELASQAQRDLARKWGAYLLDYSNLLGFNEYTSIAGRFTSDGLHPTIQLNERIANLSTKFIQYNITA